MSRIEVINQIDDHNREVYRFNWLDQKVIHSHYSLEEKPPRKRKWRTVKSWDRLDNRMNRIKEEPKLPDHIREQAYKKACEQIKVMTSEEWKNRF